MSRLARHSMPLLLLALCVIAAIASGGVFLKPDNIVVLLYQSSIVGILAVAQGIVIISGGIDLSLAAVAVLVSMLLGASTSDQPSFLPLTDFWGAIALALAVAAAFGIANGLLAAFTRIPVFMSTLATYLAATGVAYLTTSGAPVFHPAGEFERFGGLKLGLIPVAVLVWLAIAVGAHLLWRRSRVGVSAYAIGGNERAAVHAGLAVAGVKLRLYFAGGMLAAVAGFLMLSRSGAASPAAGGDLLLASIAAVVVGGVSLEGGRGSLLDVLIGVLILAVVGNLLALLLVPPGITVGVNGAIILAAVVANAHLKGTEQRARRTARPAQTPRRS
jgi:ribose/xylose/arabinose/galactoside ABC-type transport system permease subunit